MSTSNKKWITIADIRQGYLVMNYLNLYYLRDNPYTFPLSSSVTQVQKNINFIIEKLPIDEQAKPELVLSISNYLTTEFQPNEFKFVEDNELNCLYVWLRLLSNQTVCNYIKEGFFPEGNNHLDRLGTIYYYFDIIRFDGIKYDINTPIPKGYDKTSILKNLKKDCAKIYMKKIPFFSRIKKQKALTDWMWERYYLPQSFTPYSLIPNSLPGELAIRPSEDKPVTNINLNDYLNVLLPHEKELALQAIYCSWDDKCNEKNKFYKKIRRTLEKQRFRMEKEKENKKLVQAHVSIKHKEKLKAMAKFYKMNMSEIIEFLIAQHLYIPPFQKKFTLESTQDANDSKNDNTDTSKNSKFDSTEEYTVTRNGIKQN